MRSVGEDVRLILYGHPSSLPITTIQPLGGKKTCPHPYVVCERCNSQRLANSLINLTLNLLFIESVITSLWTKTCLWEVIINVTHFTTQKHVTHLVINLHRGFLHNITKLLQFEFESKKRIVN